MNRQTAGFCCRIEVFLNRCLPIGREITLGRCIAVDEIGLLVSPSDAGTAMQLSFQTQSLADTRPM